MSSSVMTSVKVLSIFTSLVGSGGIAALSLFDVPELQSQPASRALPSTRWLFSRGSHIFPQAAFLSSAGFLSLAYNALPPADRTFGHFLRATTYKGKILGYIVAAFLSISIAPWTTLVMVPNNFALIKMNEERGGARSENSAKHLAQDDANQPGKRSAEDSVNSKGEGPELTDLSRPQGQTTKETTAEEDAEVTERLRQFGIQNFVRAFLLGGGGLVGLLTALT